MKHFVSSTLALLLTVAVALGFSACNSSDDLNTDQYGNDISLLSFGPSPVLRGGTLHFLGSNLDQVSEVRLPGADPITAINVVTAGTHSEITIQVPAEKCDTGRVTLVTAKGGTIVSLTPVTYREDITVDTFYVGTKDNLTGNVGDIVTIEGDYLNLIHAVVFADNDTVSEEQFANHDRYTIEVAIPEGARTGKLTLTDLADTPTELQTGVALVVNLPTVTGLTPETARAGQTITLAGTSLSQIASVELQGATVEASAFATQTAETLTFELPREAADGEVTAVTKSGVKIPAGNLTTIVPTELSASPAPVKNGAQITITGKDLDLVDAISFPNADGTISSLSATKLVATVPTEAQQGDITLTLANGKTVTVAYTLVKPAVSGVTPSTVVAGNRVIIRGTNLDLVASVTFPGDTPQTVDRFGAQSATAIGLTVPTAAAGTGFTLNLKNGEKVAVASGLTIVASTSPAVGSISTTSAVAGTYVTITGANLQNVENIYLGTLKVTKYSSRSASEIVFQVPTTAQAGSYELRLVDFDGQSYAAGTFTVESAEVDITACCVQQGNTSAAMSFPVALAWGDEGRFRIQNNLSPILKDMKLTAGSSKLIFYKTGSGQLQFNNANWSAFNTYADWDNALSAIEVVLSQDMIDWITGAQSDGWSNSCFIVQGDGFTISKVTIKP